jgi:ParB family chromosome partitioning protein
MDHTIELRIVDSKTLIYADKRDPRQVPADRLSDAALKANSKAIGFIQPPLFSEEEDGTLTIIAGRRRIRSAIANKLKQMAILVKPADPLDDMRAVAENVVRAPMSPVDLWRAIEDLASKSWMEEAIATAFAVPLRQVRKLRLLGAILPAMLEHMGRGDMPEERYLRTIASAPLSEQAAVWTKQKPKKGQTAAWYAIANSLAKRQMFARDAKFGEKEQAAFGIVWTEDLFAPADEDSRTRPTSTPFLARSSPGSKPTCRRTGKSFKSTNTALPGSRRARLGSGAANPAKRIALRSPSTRETGRSARSISRRLPPLRRRRGPVPATAGTRPPLSPGRVPTSPRRAAR